MLLVKFCLIFLALVVHVLSEKTTIQNNTSRLRYMIVDGYRPKTHILAKTLVSIRTRDSKIFGDNHFCAGSIYKPHVIVTAAHCVFKRKRVFDRWKLIVVAGTYNRLRRAATTQVLNIKKIIPHPKFKPPKFNYDIAILILRKAIKFDGETTASVDLVDKDMPSNTECITLGWGMLFQEGPLPAEIVYADLTLVPKEFCSLLLARFNKTGMICADNPSKTEVDTCLGDSGGPLICESKLTGIVSWGKGCGTFYPAVFTDVWHYRQWIMENNASIFISTQQLYFMWIIVLLILVTTYF